MHSFLATCLAALRGRVIFVEQPYRPRTRPFELTLAGRQILASLARNDQDYHATLRDIGKFKEELSRIARDTGRDDLEPSWGNGLLPGLDSMYLYWLIRTQQPKVYFEVGSGFSTKMVRKAIKDGSLSTKIISIDPHPRAEIDRLCDTIIRQPYEDVDSSIYLTALTSGDVVFIDNSHRSFQSSDVTVFFTETLPALPAGVIWGVHDIFLPYDYPEHWQARFYNEQYLLVAYLLGGQGGDEILFPGFYISTTAQFSAAISEIFDAPCFQDVERHAGAFWMRRGG